MYKFGTFEKRYSSFTTNSITSRHTCQYTRKQNADDADWLWRLNCINRQSINISCLDFSMSSPEDDCKFRVVETLWIINIFKTMKVQVTSKEYSILSTAFKQIFSLSLSKLGVKKNYFLRLNRFENFDFFVFIFINRVIENEENN